MLIILQDIQTEQESSVEEEQPNIEMCQKDVAGEEEEEEEDKLIERESLRESSKRTSSLTPTPPPPAPNAFTRIVVKFAGDNKIFMLKLLRLISAINAKGGRYCIYERNLYR